MTTLIRKTLLVFLVFLSQIMVAETLFWKGGDGNFHNPQNWLLTNGEVANSVPNEGTDVVIDKNGELLIQNNIIVNSLSISSEAILTTGVNVNIEVKKNVFFNSFPREVNGKLTIHFNNKDEFLRNRFGRTYFTNKINVLNNKRANNGNGGNQILSHSLTVTENDVTCNGYDDGSACVSISGGTGPFTITWYVNASEYSNDPCITDLAPGTYSVGVLDQANGDTEWAVANITEPASLSVIITGFNDPSCDGFCDGDATGFAIPGTGTPPYSYQWNDPLAQGTATASNLCSGTYTVTVTDDNGCQSTADVTLTDPPPLTATTSQVNATCNGDCDASGTVVPAGGTSPYTYDWDDPADQSTATANALCAGTYNVIVTDDNACTLTETIVITEPDLLLAVASGTNITCTGDGNGSVTSTPTGGSAPYTFYWDPPLNSTNQTITGLQAGTYTVTVTDDNGCTHTDSYTVTEPTPLTTTSSGTDLSCFGVCDGTTTASPSGGTTPYTYAWDDSGSQGTQTATGLCDGTYTVTVTDDNGCTITSSVTIVEPDELIASIVGSTDVSCFGTCDGDITGTSTGGTAPISYLWDDPSAQTTLTASGLCQGSFQLIATDANGCTSTISGDVDGPDQIQGNPDVTDPSCNGICDGEIELTTSGGNGAPYTYLWDDPATSTTSTIINLCDRDYTVVITDANGCTQNETITVTEPDPILPNATGTPVTCTGMNDGTVSSLPSGGTAPYSYLWDDPSASTTSGVSGLPAGTYNVIVTDANGCQGTDFFEITEPTSLSVSSTTTDVDCFGDCDGEATLTPSGGTLPYTYLWDDPATQDSIVAINLCAGTYNATVTDASGCTVTETVTITEPDDIVITLIAANNMSCNGVCDGSILISVAGGTPGYFYTWDDPASTSNNNPTGLCDGTYKVIVEDSDGCQDSLNVTINEPTLVTGTISPTMVSCNGVCDGEAAVTPSGGNGAPYTYLWDDPSAQDSIVAIDLCAGEYVVTITDNNGCQGTDTIDITQPDPLVINSSSNDASCVGACDGDATATPNDGTPPYTYLWDDPSAQTTAMATGLCIGTFTVTVTDANGCQGTATENIAAPVTVTATITSSTNATCFGDCDGDATVSGGGGVPPYTYSWNGGNNANTTNVTGLCAGTYVATVTDDIGCSNTDTVEITQPDQITATFDMTEPLCFGDCNGSLDATISGGTAPYSVLWNDPSAQTTTSAFGLCAGSYNITVTDANGCTNTINTTLTQPQLLTTSTSGTDPNCYLSCDGEVVTTPSGGTAPYTYLWDDPSSSGDSLVGSLCEDVYNVTVTDDNGCTTTGSTTLTDPTQLTGTNSSTDALCNGVCDGTATVTGSGGTTPYTYLWDDPNAQTTSVASNLCAGNFDGTIIDANGCTLVQTITINEPDTIIVTLDSMFQTTCFGDCDGSAYVSISGGTPPYTTVWDDPSSTSGTAIINVCAGDYTITVTDASGCVVTSVIEVVEPTEIQGLFTVEDASCNGDCDGTITVSPMGGNGIPYTYLWNDPNTSTTAGVINLCAGPYAVVVTDTLGCTNILRDTIAEPTFIDIDATYTNLECFNVCDGTAQTNVTGGFPPYTYLWDDPSSSADTALTGLCAGTYTITVTDSTGCSESDMITLTQPNNLIGSIIDTVHVSCVCTGEAEATVVGGTFPYSFEWNDPDSTNTPRVDELCAGDYEVTITDGNNCVDIVNVTIRDTSDYTASITNMVPASCNGACDGELTVTPLNGTPPYTYLWNDPSAQTSATATGLCAGAHNVIVTDGIGCMRFVSGTVSEPDSIGGVFTETQPLCYLDCNGELTVSASGSNGSPFTYNWLAPISQSGATATNLCSDTIYVQVTDVAGCTDTLSYFLDQPDSLTANADSINVNCNGGCDGIVYATVGGGTTPYTYLWNDAGTSTTDSVFNLCPGTFEVNVTDANGCNVTSTTETSLVEPTVLTATLTDTTHVVCDCSGSATVTPTGGTAPYTYLWNDPSGQTDSTATGLCAGSYSVTVTDVNGCTSTLNVNIIDQTNFSASIFSITNANCYGECDGEVVVEGNNGVLPYTYLWSNGLPNDSTGSDFCAGDYSVIVRDAIGCNYYLPFTITEPDEIIVDITQTDIITCFGYCNGELVSSVSGGVPGYTYLWDDALAQTSATATNMCAETYTLEVTDANNCTVEETFSLFAPSELTAFISDQENVTCNGNDDGILMTRHTGGTEPVTYSWSPVISSEDTLYNLSPGSYTVTITDANGCSDDTTGIIIEPTVFTASVDGSVNLLCPNTCTGSITVSGTGGWTPYSFAWDDDSLQTTATANNLCAGDYEVIVTDSAGCSVTLSESVYSPMDISISELANIPTDCNVCNGSAQVSAFGGNGGPFTYIWSSGDAGDSSDDLCAQNYWVYATDALGCTDSLEVIIAGANGFAIGIDNQQDPSCYGVCDGEVTISAVGGSAPITFEWDDIFSTDGPTLSNGCPQSYTVSGEDADGCIASYTMAFNQPDELIGTQTNYTLSTCNAPCFGTATVTPSGGTAPYTYLWNDNFSQTDSTALSLCTSNYEVIITDANGCIDTAQVYAPGPDTLLIDLVSLTNTSCGAGCDGAIEVLASGGQGPYTYSWNDPSNSTSTSISGLCIGTYTCTVTDALGCTATYNATIGMPTDLTITEIDNIPTSCGNCDGGLEVVATGGNGAPYTYAWSNGDNGSSINGLCAQNYTVTVTDSEGCASMASFVVANGSGLLLDLVSAEDLDCYDVCDGTIEVLATGGTAPLNYSWDNGETGTEITDLCAGDYTVTVTDADNCISTYSHSITQPSEMVTVQTTYTLADCNAPCVGSSTIETSGGVAPYTYLWDDPAGQTGTTANNLCASNYFITVTDANGCEEIAEIYSPGINEFQIALLSSSSASCGGDCNGTAEVVASGGQAPYTYLWNDPYGSTSTSISGLCPGSYTVTATDANGCTAVYNLVIGQPTNMLVDIDNFSHVTCNGLCDGEATVEAMGGTLPYSYDWNNNSTDETITNLCPGSYTVDVTDANGCTASASVTIEEPLELQASISNIINITCDGSCNGQISVSSSDGTAPYSYLWSDGQTGITAIDLCEGLYSVDVTDANGCVVTLNEDITDTDILSATIVTTNVSCFGECDANLDLTVSGGTGVYTVQWDDATNSTNEDLSNLCPDDYSCEIVGSDGCTVTVSSEVTEPDLFEINLVSTQDLNCNGVCDGEGEASATGGTTPYNYEWTNGAMTSASVNDLCAGNQSVIGIDNNGCRDTIDFSLNEPTALSLTLMDIEDPTCYQVCNGSASFFGAGGTGSLNYTWSPNVSTTSSGVNLCAGDYTVTLSDDNNCSVDNSFTLDEPDQIEVSITDTSHISCLGSCDGSAIASANGGVSPYTYSWNTSPTQYGPSVSNLCIGTYIVTAIDGNGCSSTRSIEINDANILTATMTEVDVTCNGLCDGSATVSPNGGVGPYNYSWSTSQTAPFISDLCAGNYFVSIVDANGCTLSLGASISEPAPLNALIIDSVDVICHGTLTGSATAGPIGGTPPYIYLWSNAQTSQTSTGLGAGPHSVVVEDANGCQDIGIVTLNEPEALDIDENAINASCNTVNDGAINITVTGGVGGYSTTWTGPGGYFSSSEDISDVFAGEYSVTAIDENGCEITSTVQLDAIVYVNANAGLDTSICDSKPVTLSGSGGAEYAWSNNVNTSTNIVSPSTSTTYILTVSDQGCTDVDSVTVYVNPNPDADAGLDQTYTPGLILTLDGSGAGDDGTYSWNPTEGLNDPTLEDPIASPSETTIYELVVTNGYGCTDTSYVTVTVVPGIIFPNGITPNGDGLNDTWEITYIEEFENPVVEIYNRWGQLLFRSVGYTQNWDGTYNNEPLPVGTYYYVIELGGNLEPLTGPVTIMR